MSEKTIKANVQSAMKDIEPYLVLNRKLRAYVRGRIELACRYAERDGMKQIMTINKTALRRK